VAILDEGITAGELRTLEPRVIAFLLVGMVQWAYRWYSPAGPLSVDQLTDVAIDLLARGIVL